MHKIPKGYKISSERIYQTKKGKLIKIVKYKKSKK